MTNPDERRGRVRVSTSTESEGIVPLNFGASLAAQIPQVQMPVDWNAPRQFPLPAAPAPMERIGAIFSNPVGVVPFAPIIANNIWGVNVAATIPQVQLPAGWNSPLANPVPVVPPAPQLQTRRGRGRGRGSGPLHNISGGQADPALNGLHRGHIALRERTAEYNAHIQQLQQQAEAARQHQQELLQKIAEESRTAEAAAARETMLQQLAEQERQRQAAEAEMARQDELHLLQQLAEEENQRQAAAQQAALAAEPLYHDPPRHIDIQAALQEWNRREQEWIQRMDQMWRNERHAEEQVELDEQEELQRISIEDRNLHEKMMRLDELANNMSRTQINEYQAQVAAQAEQIQTDREMAAALAAEYQEQRNNEIALRREMEEMEDSEDDEDEDEDEDEEYDEFGRVTPLWFPPSSSPLQSPSTHSPSLPPRSPSLEFHPPPPPPPPPRPARPLPPGHAPYREPLQRHSLGSMNVQCPHCHALHFDCEKLAKSTRAVPKFGSCCLQGQIQLPPFHPAPATLRDLLCGRSPFAKEFKKNIRQYNAAFAFTSVGVNIDHKVTGTSGPYAFRIQGDLHHLSGALMPPDGRPAVFA
jgi:hypothetical protein